MYTSAKQTTPPVVPSPSRSLRPRSLSTLAFVGMPVVIAAKTTKVVITTTFVDDRRKRGQRELPVRVERAVSDGREPVERDLGRNSCRKKVASACCSRPSGPARGR